MFSGYLFRIIIIILIALRSQSLVFQWISMEVRSILFLPLLCSGDSENYVLGGVKYFLSQTPPAVIVLIRLIIIPSLMYEIFVVALFFKIGVPPFHGWVFRIITTRDPICLGILLTLIKFLPLLILSTASQFRSILNISMVIFIFILILTIGNIVNIITVIVLSSIGNSYWVLSSLIGSSPWLEFILIYILVTVFMFFYINISKVQNTLEILYAPARLKIIIILYLMCMGGIPPIVVFFFKLIIIKAISVHTGSVLLLLLVGGILLIFYMNVRFNLLLLSPSPKENSKNTYKLSCFIMIYITSPGIRALMLI